MASGADRLPEPRAGLALHPAVAPLRLRPWFDAVALRFITRLHLPISRAWSRALSGDIAEFTDALELRRAPGPLIRRAIAATAAAGARYRKADAEWERAMFGPGTPIAAVEVTRHRAAERLMLSQRGFLPLVFGRGLAPVGWDIPTPERLKERHAQRRAGEAFPAPDRIEIRRSGAIAGPDGPQFWLRMPAPSRLLSDEAWAHVYEPEGIDNPATLIFLHGICMEMEFWPDPFDPIPRLARRAGRPGRGALAWAPPGVGPLWRGADPGPGPRRA